MVSLGANYIQMRSAVQQSFYRNQENDRFQVEQSKKLGQLKARDSVISSLLDAREKDSTLHAKNQGALKARINALKGRSGISFETSGNWIAETTKDSLIVTQDSLIQDLENERDTLYLTDNIVIDSLQSQVEEITGLFREQWKRADRFQREYDREKRKRFSLGIQAGYGFKGPDIQIGVQYTILRF